MALNKKFEKEVEEAYNKELDRDIINLSLPEIDWTTPPTGYPKNYTQDSIERRRKEREEGKK
jgi:phospholipase C